MIEVDFVCDRCKHKRALIDNWQLSCDAFPEGIPKGFLNKLRKKNITDFCNNEIKFEPIEKHP